MRPFDITKKRKQRQQQDTATYEETIECLELMESGYYECCMCGWNGEHDEDAENDFYEDLEW